MEGRDALSHRLPLAEEREMLKLAYDLPKVGDDEMADYLRKHMGVAAHDQYKAAAIETKHDLHHLSDSLGREVRQVGQDPILAAQLYAAVTRCFIAHHCAHAVAGTRPLLGLFAARVITCQECIDQFLDVVAEQDLAARTNSDLVCDLCLEEAPDGIFVHFVLAYGPVQVMGDACRSCRSRQKAFEV